MDFQDGQQEVIGGVTYVRQGGMWHPQVMSAPARQPSPQTPAQATSDQLGVVHQQQQIEQVPLQNQHTQAEIQQTQTQIKNTAFDNVNNLRKQFEAEQSTQDYKTVLPLMDNAFKLGPNKAGDLNLVYAFGKTMDPNSVVREGEQVMATNVGGVSEKVKGYLDQINGGAGLTPVQRTQLTEEIRNRARSLKDTYNQRRAFYEDFAKRNGINPEDVIGPHPAAPFQNDEKAYVAAHNGGATKLSPEQQQEFFGILQSKGPAAGNAYLQQFGLALQDEKAAAQPHSNQIEYPAVQGLAEGLGGVAQGVGDALGIVSNPFVQGVNAITGSNYNPDMGTNLRDALGLPAASSAPQEFVNKVGGAALMGGGMAGAARAAIPYAGEVAANALSNFAARPGMDAMISGASGGSAEAARQAGAGPGGQLIAGLAGGAVSAPIASRMLSSGISPSLNALLSPGKRSVPPLVDSTTGTLNEPLEPAGPAGRVNTAKQFGIDLPMGSAGDRTAAIIERKLDVRPASAGIMNDHRRVVEGQVQNAAENVASNFGGSRTLNEAGGELQRGAKKWMTRFDETTSKAYNAIPISPKAPAILNNTKATLEQLSGKLESNPELQQEIRDPSLLRYLDAINKGGLDWQGIKEFRTFVGNKIGQFRFSEDARTGDYRALYGALSEDMRASASAQGPQALRAFERANAIKANGERVIEESLSRILGPDAKGSPEKAAAAVQAMTKGGKSTGDLKTLAAVRAATVKSGAWDEVAGAMIRIGGKPADSPGRGFDPGTFVRWYSDMSESARGMLFRPELRKSLDQFVMVNQRLANSNALRNTSNTALASQNGQFSIPAAGVAFATGHPLVAGGILAATAAKSSIEYGAANLWTSPKFVQWATGYSRAVASGNQNAIKSQLGRVSALAAGNPSLREPLLALQQRLLGGANDNAMRSAAASQSNSEEQ